MLSMGFKTLLLREVFRFLRIIKQTILPPIINAALFIVIFGFLIGKEIETSYNVSFTEFFIPGLIMLALITGSYSNAAFSLFISRFLGQIQDLLVAPISYIELVSAITLGGVIRGITTALLIYLTALIFVPIMIHDFIYLILITSAVSFLFASLGLLVGLIADEFEHIEIPTVFVLTPLTYLGGVFHSITFLPPLIQQISMLNPVFYMINGFRYSLIGIREADLMLSLLIPVILAAIVFAVNVKLFSSGYKLRI